MSSATSHAQALPEGLDFYRVRDDIAHQYNPANSFELMLVTQITQAWLCLQQAYETQRRYFQANDVLEAIAKQFPQYKAVTREVTNCERVWRHAVLHLEKVQRQRRRNGPNFPERPRTVKDPDPAPASAISPGPDPQGTRSTTPVSSSAPPAKTRYKRRVDIINSHEKA
jgi:hypothetical protein